LRGLVAELVVATGCSSDQHEAEKDVLVHVIYSHDRNTQMIGV
ncbi:MAG: hypothetical protein RIT52_1929, partial [Pseudomonadota bacterium]